MTLLRLLAATLLILSVGLINPEAQAGPKRLPKIPSAFECRENMELTSDFVNMEPVVKFSDIPRFQKIILDNFIATFKFRPVFKEDPLLGLVLLDTQGEYIARMGYQIVNKGQTISFGLTEVPYPWFRKLRLTELLLSEVLLENPKIQKVSTSFNNETNYRVLKEGLENHLSYDDALSETPAARRLARFGFVLDPKGKQDRKNFSFSYVKIPDTSP